MNAFKYIACVAGIGAVLLQYSTSVAEESRAAPITLAIAAQPLDQALNEWAAQTGFSVLVEIEGGVDRLMAPNVTGALTPEASLQQLLARTGLTYKFVDAKTVSIAQESVKTSSSTSAGDGSSGELRLAQSEAGARTDATAGASSDERERPSRASLDEVVVTGTHIRGAEPVGAKVITIDRDYIDKSGYATIQDVLRTLPQMAPGPKETFPNGSNGEGNGYNTFIGNYGLGAGVNLRGLGIGATLVLVNGIRQPSSGANGAFVDISNIPLAAVERIEVLPDGASALYGSDAIGGVVNIILRRDYQGFETRVRFGTLDGDANEIRLSQLAGFSPMGARALIGYEYYKRQSLAYTDRSFSANSDQRSKGGSDYSSFFSNPGNILDPTTFQLAYAVPPGQGGSPADVGDLIPIDPLNDNANANVNNINQGLQLLPVQRRDSVFFNVSKQVGSRAEVFSFGRYSTAPYDDPSVQRGVFLEVPSTNPFFIDPFGGSPSVFMFYNFDELIPSRIHARTDTYDGTLGTRFDLNGGWQATISASYARQSLRYRTDQLSFTALSAALSSTDASVALNPFGDGSSNNSSTLASLFEPVDISVRSTTASGSIAADGTVFSLPGGQAKLAVGVDFIRQTLDTQATIGDPISRVEGLSRRNTAGFVELVVPLIGEANSRPGVQQLQLSLAERYEKYSDWGHTTVPKVGLDWKPLQTLRLRGTWGKSFRAPDLIASDDTQFFRTTAISELLPEIDGSDTFAILVQGNSQALRDERGKEWTVGLDFDPAFSPGLSLSMTYFNNRYFDRIGTGGTPGSEFFILLEEDIWSSLINRNPSQADYEQFCTGIQPSIDLATCEALNPIIVDLRLKNIARTNVDGLDVRIEERLPTARGDFDFVISGTKTFHNEFALATTTSDVDLLDHLGGPLSLRIQGAVGWSYGSFGVNARAYYIPDYSQPFGRPDGTDLPIDSWTTLDLGFSYRSAPGDGWTNGITIMVNAVNVLDEDPPFANVPSGFDSGNADPYGRMISVEAVKSW